MKSPYERVDIHVRCCFVSDATFKRCQRFEEQNGRFERVSQTGNGRLPAANWHRFGRVPGQWTATCGNHWPVKPVDWPSLFANIVRNVSTAAIQFVLHFVGGRDKIKVGKLYSRNQRTIAKHECLFILLHCVVVFLEKMCGNVVNKAFSQKV